MSGKILWKPEENSLEAMENTQNARKGTLEGRENTPEAREATLEA